MLVTSKLLFIVSHTVFAGENGSMTSSFAVLKIQHLGGTDGFHDGTHDLIKHLALPCINVPSRIQCNTTNSFFIYPTSVPAKHTYSLKPTSSVL